MRLLLCALLLVLAPSLAHARNAVPVNVQKIAYQRSLPAAVVRRMPRRAKSFYWGTFRLASTGPQYGLHLFKVDPSTGQKFEGFKWRQEFTLDIFEFRRSAFRRINSLPLNYASFTWGVSKVGVAVTWLDPRSRKIPLIQFDIFTKGAYGNIGENVYVAFPRGLKGQASVRSLQFGGWHASGSSGQINQLRLGKSGTVEILAKVYPAPNEFTAQEIHDHYTFALHWDTEKQNFVPDAHAKRIAEEKPSLKPFMGLPWKYEM